MKLHIFLRNKVRVEPTIGLASLLWPPYVIGQATKLLPSGFFLLVMVAPCNRADHYIFILWFILLLLLFSLPNLSGRRLDVYHTFTHGVALV